MLKKRLIPCLDVKNGRVVKGINFVNLTDAGNPVEQAKIYNDAGADEICFLDIAASVENKETIIDVIKKTAAEIFIPLTVGGGIKSTDDIRKILLAGADKVSINTSGIYNPDLIKESSKKFGNQCIVVAIDVKKQEAGSWKVQSLGGTKKTNIDVLDWATNVESYGAGELLITSMDRDGTKIGFDNSLLKTISSKVNIPIIASGGAGKLEHFRDAIIKGGCSAVLAASVFHFGELKISDIKEYLVENNIPMRIQLSMIQKNNNFEILDKIYSIINDRKKSRKKNSYTYTLMKKGNKQIAQKVMEESSELIIDFLKGSKKRTIEEAADLIFHLLILLNKKNILPKDLAKELKSRYKK